MIVVAGNAYPVARQPFIGDLRLLKSTFGFGWGTVAKRLSGIEAENFMELLDDQDFIEALLAWIWMAKMRAGEREVTLADVEQIALDDITFTGGDDEKEGIEATPQSAPTGSGRGASKAPAASSTRASTKKSKKPSTAASP